jgi:hypothetical protein
MWISRDEYNRLKAFEKRRDDYINSLYYEIDQLRRERLECWAECEEYKQKYADEVNKRLELIQFYEGKNNSKAMV